MAMSPPWPSEALAKDGSRANKNRPYLWATFVGQRGRVELLVICCKQINSQKAKMENTNVPQMTQQVLAGKKWYSPTLLSIGFVLVLVGVILIFASPRHYYPSSCWGHLGCNYLQMQYNFLIFVGIFFETIGFAAVFNGFFPKIKAIKKVLLTIVVIVAVLIITRLIIQAAIPALVFVN
ncbi:MAG: hypothetical protein KGJ93_04320 [Patescibacteria group bacterium]|nr:hypothetical protein [Patescibacteria group bacterium]